MANPLQSGPKISLTPEERAKVIELRKKRGWKQGELSRRVRVSQATISNLESGRHPQVYRNVYLEVLRVLKAADEPPAASDERLKRVLEKFPKLDGSGQQAVEALIDALMPSPTKSR